MNDSAKAVRRQEADLDYGVLDNLLGYLLRRAQVRAFQDFAETMAPFDISPTEFGLLLLVEANSGRNQTSLAKAIGLDRSTMVAVVDRLEERGLLRRTPSPEDRRSHALLLTETGRNFIVEATPNLQRHEARLAADLSPSERRTLTALLTRLNAGQRR